MREKADEKIYLIKYIGTVLAPPCELAAIFSGPKSARVILVLKAVLYVGSKSYSER